MEREKVGKAVKEYRLKHNLVGAVAAEKIGIHLSELYQIEKGYLVSKPTFAKVVAWLKTTA